MVLESNLLKFIDGVLLAETTIVAATRNLVATIGRYHDSMSSIIPGIDGLDSTLDRLLVGPTNDRTVDVNKKCS